MLRIPTFLAESRIPGAGLGLICQAFVPAGTLVWKLDPGFEVILHEPPTTRDDADTTITVEDSRRERRSPRTTAASTATPVWAGLVS